MERTTSRAIRVGLVVTIMVLGSGSLIWISRFNGDNRSTPVGIDKSGEASATASDVGTLDDGRKSETNSRMLSASPVNVDKRDASLSDTPHSEVTDNLDERDIRSPGDGARTPTIKVITPDALRGLLQDCVGGGVGGCRALSNFAEKVASAGAEKDGGWPEWMETQVLDDLVISSVANHFSEIGASCSGAGCIFYVAANSNIDLPDRGSDKWLEKFESWLSRRLWTDELVTIDTNERLQSFAKSRIVGSATHPYIIWYVVRRRAA